jgi:hypothetical protein
VSTSTAPVVEKVTRTRVLHPAEAARESTNAMPDFWEYIEALEPSQWSDHVVYLYREDPKDSTYSTEPSYVDKFAGTIEIFPGGPSYQMDDRGIIEHAIKEKHGGKAYRLILKKGHQRIAIGKCTNGSPPKYPESNSSQTRNSLPNAAVADNVATRAMDLVANQNPQLINIAIDAVSRAADIVARHNTPPAPTTPSMDSELDRAFKQAMIQKLLAPPADPLESFLRIKQVLGDGGNSNQNPLVDKLLNAAVDRFMNPVAPVTGRTSLLDIGRELVPVFGTVMHEYRLSREADARIAEIQRSAMPPQSMQHVQPNPPAVVQQLPVAQPAQQAPPPPAAPALTFQQIENHIAKIIKDPAYPAEEAVDKVLEFLYDTDPRIVAALLNPPSLDARLKPGKEGLMMLFSAEPELQPCLANLPRLSEFLDKFIVAATEEEANQMRLRAAAPAAAPTQPAPV